MNENDKSNQVLLKELILKFYNNFPYTKSNINHELEVKFSTRGTKSLTKIDYDNVIKKIKSLGFNSVNESGEYLLRINTEFIDLTTGTFKLSYNLRTEVNSFHSIQEYCKTNDIKKLMNEGGYRSNVNVIDKSSIVIGTENNRKIYLKDVMFNDFNFSVSYKTEKVLNMTDNRVINTFNEWNKYKKSFRYINRVTFRHPNLPINVDISIVKSSSREGYGLKKTYTIDESGVFTNPEIYEIELEIINSQIGPGTEFNTNEKIEEALRKAIKYILSGLQRSNYPISLVEQNNVLKSYMKLLHKEKYIKEKRIYPSDFIGPSSYTLQIQNIIPINENINIPNIRENYLVTDKADGERHLMYISENGKIFIINTNMNVSFTGAITKQKMFLNSLLDGELVLHDKFGKFINLYIAFDIYYLDSEDIRHFGFIPVTIDEKEKDKKKYRYPILKNLIRNLKPESIIPEAITPIYIKSKDFYPIELGENNIFKGCNYILKKIEEGAFEYNTDGLIFTNTLFGVGSDKINKAGLLKKITWDYSFKWKPAEFNTIDFLISTLKNVTNQDVITPIFEDGINTLDNKQLKQYKTIILQVGLDSKTHIYKNPCQDVIDDKLPEYEDLDNEDKYVAQPFIPTKPYDETASICKVMLEPDGNGVLQMKTEEGEVFDDNTIVEFKYDLTKKEGWRWVPLRVRYDKTSELKQSLLGVGKPNYGNAYHVANNNWKSIHDPITKRMITGMDIPDILMDDDVYYNRILTTTNTRSLRDFHNLYVKKLLITSVSKRGDTMIDYACGKGGDFSKWIAANLSFVFGIDKSKDNLEDRIDGACSRFLNLRKKFKTIPYALFVNGDSTYNIRNGSAMLNEKAIQITKAVFGEGPKDEEKLGKGVFRQYGKGQDGFNISSCQFAIHYFTENKKTFHNFMKNLAECTALNGYFIGSSYDGKIVYNMLKNKNIGEGIQILDEGKKIWEIKKQYDSGNYFNDDASCLGYKIEVFQETINQLIPEFLVNYDYLNRVMENYGFKLITRDEARNLGLPEGSGLFSELFILMEEEVKKNKNKANDYGTALNMNLFEKKISFLNRYFIYKKIRKNIKVVTDEEEEEEEEKEKEEEEKIEKPIIEKKSIKSLKPRIKKLNTKLLILPGTESSDKEEKPKVKKPKKLILIDDK